jgi:hypothetical protein
MAISGLDPEYQEEVESRMNNPLEVDFDDLQHVNLRSDEFQEAAFVIIKSVRLGLNSIERRCSINDYSDKVEELAKSEFLNTITDGSSYDSNNQLGHALKDGGQSVFDSIAAYAVKEAQNELEELQNTTE